MAHIEKINLNLMVERVRELREDLDAKSTDPEDFVAARQRDRTITETLWAILDAVHDQSPFIDFETISKQSSLIAEEGREIDWQTSQIWAAIRDDTWALTDQRNQRLAAEYNAKKKEEAAQ